MLNFTLELFKILIGLLPASVLSSAVCFIWDGAVQLMFNLSLQFAAVLVICLVLLSLILCFWLVTLSPWLKYVLKYDFYEHRITGLPYCGLCRYEKSSVPLKKIPKGWKCKHPSCSQFYLDPDDQTPSQKAPILAIAVPLRY